MLREGRGEKRRPPQAERSSLYDPLQARIKRAGPFLSAPNLMVCIGQAARRLAPSGSNRVRRLSMATGPRDWVHLSSTVGRRGRSCGATGRWRRDGPCGWRSDLPIRSYRTVARCCRSGMTLGEFGSQCVLVRVAVTKPSRPIARSRLCQCSSTAMFIAT
jgi:hypothetical protein